MPRHRSSLRRRQKFNPYFEKGDTIAVQKYMCPFSVRDKLGAPVIVRIEGKVSKLHLAIVMEDSATAGSETKVMVGLNVFQVPTNMIVRYASH